MTTGSTGSATFRDGAFVSVFGRSGSGKTTEDFASFPNAEVCAGTREFKPAMTVLGHIPPVVHEVSTLFDVQDRVDALLKAREQKGKTALTIDAFIVDDFTVLSYQTENALQKGDVNKKYLVDTRSSGYAPWNNQKAVTLTIAFNCAERLRQAGLHFVVNGHERVAYTDKNGKFYRGGIDLPVGMTEGFCAGTNLMARVIKEPERLFFETIYNIGNNGAEWATKNQFGLPALVPSNLREILNSAGYKLSRARGMEKHEEYVEQISQVIAAGIGDGAYSKKALGAVLEGPKTVLLSLVQDPRHVRWILRDASDRALIRREARRSILGEIGAQPVVAGMASPGAASAVFTPTPFPK